MRQDDYTKLRPWMITNPHTWNFSLLKNPKHKGKSLIRFQNYVQLTTQDDYKKSRPWNLLNNIQIHFFQNIEGMETWSKRHKAKTLSVFHIKV